MWGKIKNIFNKLVDDTLKKDGKWSRTSLTMFTAWAAVLGTYLLDFFKNGFNFEAFCVLVGVALGSKVTDAWSKKMINGSESKGNPENP